MKKFILVVILSFIGSLSYSAPMTAGYIPKAKSGTVLNDSVIYQNVVNIGIGSSSPRAKLEVNGAIYSSGNISIGTLSPRGNIDVTGAIWLDNSVYFAGTATGGVGLWLSQPDGGCSLCGPDNAGTTFSCVNRTCPTGM